MIYYRYSLYWDLVWMSRNFKNRKKLKERGLKLFSPNIFYLLKLLMNLPSGPQIATQDDIFCYWLSSGTWGSYTKPDKIFICPREIEKTGGLERVIKHELAHLKYSNNVAGMSHEDKEKYVYDREHLS